MQRLRQRDGDVRPGRGAGRERADHALAGPPDGAGLRGVELDPGEQRAVDERVRQRRLAGVPRRAGEVGDDGEQTGRGGVRHVGGEDRPHRDARGERGEGELELARRASGAVGEARRGVGGAPLRERGRLGGGEYTRRRLEGRLDLGVIGEAVVRARVEAHVGEGVAGRAGVRAASGGPTGRRGRALGRGAAAGRGTAAGREQHQEGQGRQRAPRHDHLRSCAAVEHALTRCYAVPCIAGRVVGNWVARRPPASIAINSPGSTWRSPLRHGGEGLA